jgi:Protein of unknown function (DUF2914)
VNIFFYTFTCGLKKLVKGVISMKRDFIGCLVLVLCLAAGVSSAQQTTAPAPPVAPAAQAAAAAPATGLTLARMEIAASVEDREPAGIAATFPATTEKVYCYPEFRNVSKETKVNVVWTLGSNEMGNVPLTIKPYAKFRTWASKTINGMKGDWKVEVKDEAGTVLKSATFKVE